MLGLGSMNGAILTGLLGSDVEAANVVATTRSQASAQAKAVQYGVRVIAEEADGQANIAAVTDADVVVLGVKPYQITGLCDEIAEALKPSAVVVSVAAAITAEMMEDALRNGQPVVRAMPNTPTSVGLGVIGLAGGTSASHSQVQQMVDLLSPVASVHVMEEAQIDAVSAVAGSGPAYAFYLAEHMAAAGAELGLDPELAAELAAQTIYGAGKMLVENRGRADAAQLRINVTSPNGTTERALAAFDAAEMGATIRAGVNAAAARSAELTEQLKG